MQENRLLVLEQLQPVALLFGGASSTSVTNLLTVFIRVPRLDMPSHARGELEAVAGRGKNAVQLKSTDAPRPVQVFQGRHVHSAVLLMRFHWRADGPGGLRREVLTNRWKSIRQVNFHQRHHFQCRACCNERPCERISDLGTFGSARGPKFDARGVRATCHQTLEFIHMLGNGWVRMNRHFWLRIGRGLVIVISSQRWQDHDVRGFATFRREADLERFRAVRLDR